MLRIGEFAGVTGISIHMLRNYDRMGLLKPEWVDEGSGYRYYSAAQIVEAGRIQVLKGLGFGLQEIMTIQGEHISGAAMEAFLRDKIARKMDEAAALQVQVRRMEAALKDIDGNDQCALAVCVKKFPAQRVVGLRAVLKDFPEEGLLWQRLGEECKRYGVRLADVPYSFAITHSVDWKGHRIDTEVLRVVEKDYPKAETLSFRVMPETEVASVAYRGIYSRIGDINTYICKWIGENGYAVTGKSFQAYYTSPEYEENPENFITEVCFPICKKKI